MIITELCPTTFRDIAAVPERDLPDGRREHWRDYEGARIGDA